MTTNRSIRFTTLTLAFIAMIGSTALACTTADENVATPRHHVVVACEKATATSPITEAYLSDRAALLQAALHLDNLPAAERTLARRTPTLASNVQLAPASEVAL